MVAQTSSFAPEEFIRHANETKADTQDVFDALGLPTYRRIIRPLDTFDAATEEGLANFTTPNVWFQIIRPESKDAQLDIPINALNVAIEPYRDTASNGTLILVSEYLDNRYGGNIVITPEGQLIAEFGAGTNTDYTAGNATLGHFISSAHGTQTLRYSFDDPQLRQTMYDAIRPLRRGGEVQPGYYEFILGDDNGKLRPIYTDARLDNPIYQMPEQVISNSYKHSLGSSALQHTH